MTPLLYIEWNVDPNLFEVGPLTIRWYGLLFAVAFLLGHYVLKRMFDREEVPERWLDKVLIYTIVGTIIGARLGHVFFYDWGYYSENLSEIPQIWKGGLASHGGAIGIILALYAFSKWISKKPLLWILDRVAPPIALGGFFIRLGNLMNSEIVGEPTDLPWGFKFQRLVPPSQEAIPRHPVQIYESLSYLLIFFILLHFYWRTDSRNKQGFLIGMFMILVFTARFFIEFVKMNQNRSIDPSAMLNMGQWLSIPFILIGAFLVFRSRRKS